MRDAEGGRTLSARQFRLVLDTLERMGVAVDAVLARCATERAALADPCARFPVDLEERLWLAIELLTGDPHIGLRLGAALARRAEREVDVYLALNSGTLRCALGNLLLLVRLADDRAQLELREHADSAMLVMPRESARTHGPGRIDAMLASAVALLTDHIDGFRLTQVELTRARPFLVEPYIQIFGVTPSFGATHNVMRFDRTLLDAPIHGLEHALAQILGHSDDLSFANSPRIDPLLFRVENALHNRSAISVTSLTMVARALATSPRTLRRRLNERGTSFRAVLDGLRRDLAQHQLRNSDLSVEQLAERLGFSTTSAFQRAFRRWHGVPPSVYRARLRTKEGRDASEPRTQGMAAPIPRPFAPRPPIRRPCPSLSRDRP